MKTIITTIAILSNIYLIAQNNVGIGTLTPNSQAILEIESNDKGILISRLTTIARNTLGTALTLTEDGMLVYDKDLTTFFYWDGPNLQWVQVGSGTGDNWGTQIVQTSGTNISGDGTNANPLIITDGDSDPNNEIELPTTAAPGQILSWDGTDWIAQTPASGADNWGTDIVNTSGTNISGNGTTTSPISITEVDGDVTNEIQDLSLNTTTNILTITNNGSATNIDLSSYLDNTDAQTLTLSGSTLSISNGNNVTLVDNINDADADPTNEHNTGANLTGNNLNIIDGGGTQTVDLSSLKDHDWYEVGGTTQPDAITDNIFTQGKVGIAGTSPVTFLDVLDLSTDTLKSVLARLPEGNNSGKGSYLGVFSHGTQPANIRSFSIQHRFYDTVNTSINFLRGATHYDGEISFGTKRNIERMRIDVNGNVGIGTPLPSDRLHIEGNQYMHHTDQSQIHLASENNTSNHSANIRMSNLTSNNGWLITEGHLNSDDNFTIQSFDVSNNYTHRFYINHTNGDVGINTNAPTAQLDVNGDLRVRNIPAGVSTDELLVANSTGNVRKLPLKITDTWQAIGNTNISTTSHAYVDMPDMTLNINLIKSADVFISWDATLSGSGAVHQWGAYRILVDGVPVNWGHLQAQDSWDQTSSLNYIAQNLNLGAHIIKIQWALGHGTSFLNNAASTADGKAIWSRQLRAIAYYY